jgi:two-component system cell cycle response regulator DivK
MPTTVLVIEDNSDERTLYATITRHFGYDVIEAGNATEGMRLAQEQNPDLILMDVHMPDMNGLDATKLLKADPGTAHIPIIAMTVHRVSPSTVMESGANAYLPKPFLPRELGQTLASLLGKPIND